MPGTTRYQEILDQTDQLGVIATPVAVLGGLLRQARASDASTLGVARRLLLAPGVTLALLARTSSWRPDTGQRTLLDHIVQRNGLEGLRALLLEHARAAGLVGADEDHWTRGDPGIDERLATRPVEEEHPEKALWGHAVAAALGARLVAEQTGAADPDLAHVAGLLHDIGKDALLAVHRPSFRLVRSTAHRDRLPFIEAERRCRLPSHTLLGHSIACRWELLDALRSVIHRHHDPGPEQRGDLDSATNRLVDIVIVGDGMARRGKLGNPMDPVGSPAWGALTRKRLGLSREDLAHLSLRLERLFRDSVGELLGRAVPPAAPSPT